MFDNRNIDNDSSVVVKNISKTYKTYIKGDSILASIFFRKYNNVQAVKNISFSINQGEILGIVGLNGAGKTSIIKMVSGIMKPDSGTIKILNEDPFKKSLRYRKNVSLVIGQNNQLNNDLSIFDNVMFIATIYAIDKKTAKLRMQQMSKELNLEKTDLLKQVRTLSMGQKMKGELILSFIHLPKIVFLDEPTLGLDFIAQNSVRSFLSKYAQDQNASIILTSHYLRDIESLCKNIFIVNRGKEVYYGQIDNLRLESDNKDLEEIIGEIYKEFN